MDIKYSLDLELDGYFKALIKSGSLSYDYINMFLMNTCVKIDVINSLIIDSESFVKINKVTKHYYKLPISKIDITYKGLEYICYQVSKGIAAIRTKDVYDLPYDLLLFIKGGNKERLKELLIDSKEWYEKHILNKEKNDEEIICYNWSDWSWDVVVKQIKRNKNTLYYEDKFMDDIENDIRDFISDETKSLYTRLGITYKRSYLFAGPPGTGKSSLIYGIASIFNKDIAYLNITDELKSNSLIDSVRNIPKNAILVIEDIDSIFEKREKKEGSHRITFSSLLNCIDGVIKPAEGSIIIFTTNFKDKLDEALKRPGRIDKIISFTYATKKQIQKMFIHYFPAEEENFMKFYNKIKHIKKISICYLQQVFLKYINNTKLLYDCVEELEQIKKECDLYKSPDNLYC